MRAEVIDRRCVKCGTTFELSGEKEDVCPSCCNVRKVKDYDKEAIKFAKRIRSKRKEVAKAKEELAKKEQELKDLRLEMYYGK